MVLTARTAPARRPRRPVARTKDDAGVIAVLVTLVVVLVVLPLLALVVDLGLTRTADRRMRTAADAAALAAALRHPAGDAASTAAAVADARRLLTADAGVTDAEWAGCVDPHPLPAGTAPAPGNCVSIDPAAKLVRVTVPSRAVPTVFAGVLGSAPPAATATSTATWAAFSPPCALCVLGSYAGGAQRLEVHGGDVAVGGDLQLGAGAALVTDPGRVLTVAGATDLAGSTTTTPVPGPVPTETFATEFAALAALPAAAPTATAEPRPATGPCVPGTFQDVSTCTAFAPGVYVVTGRPAPSPRLTVALRGGGDGVLLYLTCSDGTPAAVHPAACGGAATQAPRLTVGAAAGVRLRGNPGYDGLAVAVDPGSTSAQRFAGSGSLVVEGSVAAPGAVLRNPPVTSPASLVVSGGRLVVGSVAYDTSVPVPPRALVTVTAPPPGGLPDGPVRLVPAAP